MMLDEVFASSGAHKGDDGSYRDDDRNYQQSSYHTRDEQQYRDGSSGSRRTSDGSYGNNHNNNGNSRNQPSVDVKRYTAQLQSIEMRSTILSNELDDLRAEEGEVQQKKNRLKAGRFYFVSLMFVFRRLYYTDR